MGALGCGSTCIKYLLFFFNFLCALGGLALAILGGLSLYTLKNVETHSQSHSVRTYPAMLLAIGIVIFVVAFYGCCGAVRESNCMLITFAVLLLTLIVLEVAVAAAIFANKDAIQDVVQEGISNVFVQAERNDPASITSRDVIQRSLKCCGRSTQLLAFTFNELPASCCDSPPCQQINYYKQGCVSAFQDYVETHSKSLAYVAIGVAFVELLEVCFALGLASSVRKADRRY